MRRMVDEEKLTKSIPEDIVLDLGTNAGGDPIIDLQYKKDGAALHSPIAFDKDSFEVVNDHLKTKGGGGGEKIPFVTGVNENGRHLADFDELNEVVSNMTYNEVLNYVNTGTGPKMCILFGSMHHETGVSDEIADEFFVLKCSGTSEYGVYFDLVRKVGTGGETDGIEVCFSPNGTIYAGSITF